MAAHVHPADLEPPYLHRQAMKVLIKGVQDRLQTFIAIKVSGHEISTIFSIDESI